MKSEQRCCQVLTIQETQVIFILFLFERDEKKNDKNRHHDLKLMCMKSEQWCCQFLTFLETQVIFMNQRRIFW